MPITVQTAIAVDNLEMFDEIQRSNLELEVAYDVTLEGWTKVLDYIRSLSGTHFDSEVLAEFIQMIAAN